MTRADISRRWRRRHPDKVKAQKARHYQKHKREHDAKSKAWAAAHPESPQRWRERNREKLKADKAQWYQEHKEEQKTRNRAWVAANPEARKEHVRRYYDTHSIAHRLSCARAKARVRGHVFAVEAMEVRQAQIMQGDLCAICGRPETRKQRGVIQALSIDHCHSTGRFRGLLCEACNKVLGFMEDNPERLQRAIDYLQLGQVSGSPLFEYKSQISQSEAIAS